jgi:dolichol-phosphate mannosyltransferase
MKPRVLAFFAVFNEEVHLGQILDRFAPVLKDKIVDDLLVVDDGSNDRTREILKQRKIHHIRHSQREGVGVTIRTAIDYAKQNGFDILAIQAGNDKDRPEEIIRLLKPIIEEGFDFVQGSRYLPGGDLGNMPIYRRLATQFVHPLLFSLITARRITDSTNGFRAFKLAFLNNPQIQLDQPWLRAYELEPYLFFKAIRLGYKVKEVPVTKIYPSRQLGYTKMKPITGWWSILRPLVFLGLGLKK